MIDKKEDNKEEEKNHNEKETNNDMIDKKEDNKEEEKNHNEKETNNEIKLEDDEIKKLSKIVNKYQQKFNDYYYDNTADGFDRLIEYCKDRLKKEAVKQKNTELSAQIDSFIDFLKKNKPDSES